MRRREPQEAVGRKPNPGVPPGETPPVEGSTSGVAQRERRDLSKAWGIWPAVAIVVLSCLVAVLFVVMGVVVLLD